MGHILLTEVHRLAVSRIGNGRSSIWIDYCSSVSGPVSLPRPDTPRDEMGDTVRTDSYSVTTITPGAGSSMTSMIVVSTGASAICLGVFLAAVFDARFKLVANACQAA